VPQVDLAIPAFGYKNHIAIDRAHGLIRKRRATHAAAHDGARLEDVLDRDNTASEVWADTAYRSVKNEAMLARRGFISRIHRKKPKGKTIRSAPALPMRRSRRFAAPSNMCLRIRRRSGDMMFSLRTDGRMLPNMLGFYTKDSELSVSRASSIEPFTFLVPHCRSQRFVM
jgi:hypothetical protein